VNTRAVLSRLACGAAAWAWLAVPSAPAQITLHFEDAVGPTANAAFVTGPGSWSGQGVSIVTPDIILGVGADFSLFETDAVHLFTFGAGTTIAFPEPMRRLKLDMAAITPQQTYPTFELLANGVQVTTFGATIFAPTLLDLALDPPASSVTIRYITGSSSGLLIDRLFASPASGAPDGIAHWRMEPSVPAGIAVDSLHDHDGALTGGALLGPGAVGSALLLQGNAGSVSVPDHDALDFGASTSAPGSGDFSIALWVKGAFQPGVQVLLDKRDGVRGYHLYLYQGGLGLQLADGSHANYGSPTPVADGTWHHVAVTVDRDQADGIRFYLDGVLLPETGNPTNHPGSLANAHDVWIGRHIDGSTFPGSLDEVFLAGRVLSAAEIAVLHSGPSEVPHPWADLGAPLAGVDGDPLLVGTGSLQSSSPGAFTLSNAAPDAPILLFVATKSTPAPFKGGLLKTFPFLLSYDFETGQDGSFELPFVWPAGVPSGLPFYYQFAIQDGEAPQNVALSNAIMGLTP
jgi:hypothetical protein